MQTLGYAVASDEPQRTRPKKKKIGFIKRWMFKAVKEAYDQDRQGEVNLSADIMQPQISVRKEIDQPDRAVQFTVYTANGGRVIETRRYDRKTDRHINNLYVITREQDFGREIDKIITMEALR
jgi:hypothetical protein